jgi:hypothetical protein
MRGRLTLIIARIALREPKTALAGVILESSFARFKTSMTAFNAEIEDRNIALMALTPALESDRLLNHDAHDSTLLPVVVLTHLRRVLRRSECSVRYKTNDLRISDSDDIVDRTLSAFKAMKLYCTTLDVQHFSVLYLFVDPGVPTAGCLYDWRERKSASSRKPNRTELR